MQTNADESSPPIFFFAQHFSQIFSWIPENRWGAGSKYIFKSDILFLIRRESVIMTSQVQKNFLIKNKVEETFVAWFR